MSSRPPSTSILLARIPEAAPVLLSLERAVDEEDVEAAREAARELVRLHPFLIDEETSPGSKSALFQAAERGLAGMARDLMAAGADPLDPIHKPLWIATLRGHMDCASAMVEEGVLRSQYLPDTALRNSSLNLAVCSAGLIATRSGNPENAKTLQLVARAAMERHDLAASAPSSSSADASKAGSSRSL